MYIASINNVFVLEQWLLNYSGNSGEWVIVVQLFNNTVILVAVVVVMWL